jgi:CRISPR-associated protein Csx3
MFRPLRGSGNRDPMGRTFQVTVDGETDGVVLLRVGFGEVAATNAEIVCEAVDEIRALNLRGGRGVKVNGPASLPVAFALCHEIAHKYGFVAIWDPKLGQYVVAVSHDPSVAVGTLLPAQSQM